MPQSTLTVWKFDTPDGAQAAEQTVEELNRENVLTLQDAATVSWKEGAKKPKTKQLHSTAGVGALGGSFWGLLFGLIFFIPIIGAVVGAAVGALAGSMTDLGIDDAFIKRVREEVTPGTSALFLLTDDVVLDKVKEAFAKHEPSSLIFTNLSTEQEAALREAFATE